MRIQIAFIAALGLVACSANPAHISSEPPAESQPAESTEATPEPAPEPTPEPAPAPTPAPSMPVSSPTTPSTPPAPEAIGPPCSQEVALTCDPGLVDGCLRTDMNGETITKVHACIQVTPSMQYAPCSQEIAQVCGSGMRDACLIKPSPGDKHVCVKL